MIVFLLMLIAFLIACGVWGADNVIGFVFVSVVGLGVLAFGGGILLMGIVMMGAQ